jgi:hypothetical protein
MEMEEKVARRGLKDSWFWRRAVREFIAVRAAVKRRAGGGGE